MGLCAEEVYKIYQFTRDNVEREGGQVLLSKQGLRAVGGTLAVRGTLTRPHHIHLMMWFAGLLRFVVDVFVHGIVGVQPG